MLTRREMLRRSDSERRGLLDALTRDDTSVCSGGEQNAGLMPAYEHLVLFRFKVPLSPEAAQDLLSTLRAFRTEIPGILDLSAGLNETEETGNMHGYTLGLRVCFQDRQSLADYQPHPVHQAFVRQLGGLLEDVLVMDYPVMEDESPTA